MEFPKVKFAVVAICMLFAWEVPGNAATVLNVDAEARNIIVTENGVRTDLEVPPNVTLNFCESGCFALFPSGLILPLKGSETLEIKNSEGLLISSGN